MPVDNLVSNWAYMVMAALAWTLKAWAALCCRKRPGSGETRSRETALLRMEFKTFSAAPDAASLPDRAKRGRLIYRLLSWNPWQPAFLRLVERLHGSWLC